MTADDVIALTADEHLQVLTSTPELLAMEATWTATSQPPAHFHPSQDEHFEVRSGALRVKIDGDERVVRAGESIDIPRGTVHCMTSAEGETRALWEVRPALRTEELFRALATADGNKLRQLTTVAAHRDEIRMTGPLGVLARLVSVVRRG